MSIVDFRNMDYDKGMGILKYLGYPEEDAELLAHQFAGHFEDDFGAELKTAVKESFLVALKHPGGPGHRQSDHDPKHKKGASSKPSKSGGLSALPNKIADKWNAMTPEQKATVIRSAVGIALTVGGVLASPGVARGIGGAATGIARGVGTAAHGANRAAGASMYRGIINRGHKRWAKQNRGGSLSDFLNTPAGKNLATEAGSRYLVS